MKLVNTLPDREELNTLMLAKGIPLKGGRDEV